MAIQKISGFRLGEGSLTQKHHETEIKVQTRPPSNGSIDNISVWSSIVSYSFEQPVTYENKQYRSTVPGSMSNLNNIPTVSGWEEVDGKDGDIWVQVPDQNVYSTTSSSVGMFLKVGGVWTSLGASSGIGVKLLNNYSEICLKFNALSLPYAEITYTNRRQNEPEISPNYSQSRQGKFIIQNNGATLSYTHEYQDFGNDIGCSLIPSISGTEVVLTYTSTDQSKPLEFKFSLNGWATAQVV